MDPLEGRFRTYLSFSRDGFSPVRCSRVRVDWLAMLSARVQTYDISPARNSSKAALHFTPTETSPCSLHILCTGLACPAG